jgi:hypothetical protein
MKLQIYYDPWLGAIARRAWKDREQQLAALNRIERTEGAGNDQWTDRVSKDGHRYSLTAYERAMRDWERYDNGEGISMGFYARKPHVNPAFVALREYERSRWSWEDLSHPHARFTEWRDYETQTNRAQYHWSETKRK